MILRSVRTSLSRGRCAALTSLLVASACTTEPPNGGALGTDEAPLYYLSTSLWETPSIPVCWEADGFATEKEWVRKALTGPRSWSAHANVNFPGWGRCQVDDTGIRITPGSAMVVRGGLGHQSDHSSNMELDFGPAPQDQYTRCIENDLSREDCIKAAALHEFGHSLGFAHEHNRDDTPASCTANQQGSRGDQTFGDWDDRSIMNYCGANTELSPTDIAGVQMLYGDKLGRETRNLSTYAEPDGRRRIDAFLVGASGRLQVYRWSGSAWAWVDAGGPSLVGSPSVANYTDAQGQRRQNVFAIGSDGGLREYYFDGTSWSWHDKGGPGHLVGSPSVAVWHDGQNLRLNVFAISATGALHEYWWNGQSWAWANEGNRGLVGSPAAVAYVDGAGVSRLHVWSVDVGGALQEYAWNGSAWTWTDRGGPGNLVGSPTAAVYSQDGGIRIHLFAIAGNSRLYEHRWNGSSWSWTDKGGPGNLVGSPTVANYAHGATRRLNVFARSADGRMREYWFDGSSWSWHDKGGPGNLVGSPTVVTYTFGTEGDNRRLNLWSVDGSGRLHEYWFNGTTWSWHDKGGPGLAPIRR